MRLRRTYAGVYSRKDKKWIQVRFENYDWVIR